MSNVNASEDNVESPSTYGGHAYREYRKKEKKKRQEKKKQLFWRRDDLLGITLPVGYTG